MVSKKNTLVHAASAIIFMACLLVPVMCSAEDTAWTWMSGSDQIGEFGVYGIQGVPSAANVPGARYDSASWVDEDGDLWLFGGVYYDPIDDSRFYMNDLWRYDSGTGEWTWMSGSNFSNQRGVYGSKYIPDDANTPGARKGAVSWIDSSGDLWLYGGEGYDRYQLRWVWDVDRWVRGWLNDMWRYDTTENQWSWEWGYDNMTNSNEKANFGDPGYPNPYVQPGAREGAISWIDSYGFLWMFGGYGWQDRTFFIENSEEYCWEGEIEVDNETGKVTYPEQDCTDPGALNDLWVYNPVTYEWAWVSGSFDKDQLGSYGTMGEPSFESMPGSRFDSISWIDKDNNLWLFGGGGKDIDVPDGFFRRMSDLWRYDPVAHMWTFVDGFEVGDQPGVYDASIGTLLPGCRESSSSWTDNDGKLRLQGGFGLASTYSPIGGLLNDLWSYDPAANEWAWLDGSDEISNPGETIVAGVYGTKGVSGENNVPGARESAIPWIDTLGNLWLFGGFGFDGYENYGSMNDLWLFGAPPPCMSDDDCEDDDVFCTGPPQCLDGVCGFYDGPCEGDTPACDEINDMCVECTNDSYCEGDTPACDAISNMCVECVDDSSCVEGYKCLGNQCAAKCNLVIKNNTYSAAKLWKDRKKTFKITTSSYGAVDMGPDIQIRSTKTNTKKGEVKVKTTLPAGLVPQIIPVWVGACYGEIEITP